MPKSVIEPLTIKRVEISADLSPLPATEPLYEVSKSSKINNIADITSTEYKLNRHSTDKNTETWKNNTAILSLDKTTNTFVYSVIGPKPIPKGTINLTQATSSATIILNKLGISQNILLSKPVITLYSASTPELVKLDQNEKPSKIDLIKLQYQVNADNRPVITDINEYPVEIVLDRQLKTIRLLYSSLPIETKKLNNYESIPGQITKYLSSYGVLISFETANFVETFNSSDLNSLTITNVSEVYYFSPTQNLLYPAYLLKGNGTFSDGTQASLTFLLPSIDPRYYQ